MIVDRKALREQHIELDGAATALREAVSTDVPDMERLARAKWQFGYRLAIHLAQEDKHVYPQLKRHPDQRIAQLAARYELEMGDLDQRFRDYLARWPTDRVTADWARFVGETRTLLDALDRRIVREETELYPLLADTDR